MATIQRFEEIQAWITARKLSREIFLVFQRDVAKRDFSLRDQVNRSLGSVMDNIAEGFERGGTKEFIQFLFISKGSAGETRSQLYRMVDCGYITKEEFDCYNSEIQSISRQIMGLISYLKKSEIKGDKYQKVESRRSKVSSIAGCPTFDIRHATFDPPSPTFDFRI